MKINIRQIHQTGEVRHTLAGQFTRTLDVLGGASALHCLKICEHSFQSRECTIPRTGPGLRVFISKCIPWTIKLREQHGKHRNKLRFAFYPQGCLVSLKRSGLDKEDSCLSLKKRDKKRNSFMGAFCFIQLIFQVDWMYTHFIAMRILRHMLRKCSKKSEVTLRNAFECLVCDPRVQQAVTTRHVFKRDLGLLREGCASSLKTFPAKLFEKYKLFASNVCTQKYRNAESIALVRVQDRP